MVDPRREEAARTVNREIEHGEGRQDINSTYIGKKGVTGFDVFPTLPTGSAFPGGCYARGQQGKTVVEDATVAPSGQLSRQYRNDGPGLVRRRR